MTAKYILTFLLSFTLFGCGFRPLYVSEKNDDLLQKTASIQIEPISGEIGYQVMLSLQSKLNPHQEQCDKKYRLSVSFKNPELSNKSIRSDNFASIENMDLSATYRLTDTHTQKVIISATASASGFYNVVQDPYASVVAEEKLHHNLADMIADDITTHILAYFKGVKL